MVTEPITLPIPTDRRERLARLRRDPEVVVRRRSSPQPFDPKIRLSPHIDVRRLIEQEDDEARPAVD
jgi:hypothetical protein